jgi:predicted nucleic acid-binding Zn ribbon protein
MPYYRCPACGLLAHVAADDSPAIDCTRCGALERRVALEPVEESFRLTGEPRKRPDREPAD